MAAYSVLVCRVISSCAHSCSISVSLLVQLASSLSHKHSWAVSLSLHALMLLHKLPGQLNLLGTQSFCQAQ